MKITRKKGKHRTRSQWSQMWQTRIHNNEQTENQQNIKEHFPLKGNNLQLCFVFITFSFYCNMLTSVFLKNYDTMMSQTNKHNFVIWSSHSHFSGSKHRSLAHLPINSVMFMRNRQSEQSKVRRREEAPKNPQWRELWAAQRLSIR